MDLGRRRRFRWVWGGGGISGFGEEEDRWVWGGGGIGGFGEEEV